MILTADIGNTNIILGGFDADELKFVSHISAVPAKTSDEYSILITDVLKLHGVNKDEVSGAVIASVVPPLTPVIKNSVQFLFNTEPVVVGPGIKSGIGIRCDAPASVGADLIAASVAVHFLYGSPALVIDIGTATKMTVVDKNGTFIGTSIVPGVLMGLNALSDNTAQLPKISLEKPDKVIAKNTVDCMRSGVIYGNASMIDGMISRIKEEIGYDLTVYVTGGLASFLLPYCKSKMIYDENLVLKGLNILYKKNVADYVYNI